MAVSTWFSTWTVISYFPEWLRSALRIKMMLSQSVLRMLTWVGSMGWPSFSQLTFGLGLPCGHHTQFKCCLEIKWIWNRWEFLYHKWHHKVHRLSNSTSVCLLQVSGNADLGWFWGANGHEYQNQCLFKCFPTKRSTSEPSYIGEMHFQKSPQPFSEPTNNLFDHDMMLKGPWSAGSGSIDGFDSN